MELLTIIEPRREKTVLYFANNKDADCICVVFTEQLLFIAYCHTSSLLSRGHYSHLQYFLSESQP